MAPKLKPKKMKTPGSYGAATATFITPKRKPKKAGRPSSGKKATSRAAGALKHRATYTSEDMLEAVRLVREEDYSIALAARAINMLKKNAVPRMTLSDRLTCEIPARQPALGRPQELSPAVEAALVKSLALCAEYQYPMRKKDLQDIVQGYCISQSVNTRWVNDRPGKDFIRNFMMRHKRELKLRRPTNIKRTRAAVSPTIVRAFFERLAPNVEGIPDTHLFNYDETNLRDDPGELKVKCITDIV